LEDMGHKQDSLHEGETHRHSRFCRKQRQGRRRTKKTGDPRKAARANFKGRSTTSQRWDENGESKVKGNSAKRDKKDFFRRKREAGRAK